MILLSILGLITIVPHARAGEPADTISAEALQEVTVTGQSARQRIREVRLGSERLELPRLSQVPSFAGENDILKAISLLPGVHSESDGSGGFEVRGGNAYQNLVLLDGITLYNPSHIMGIFSTFNDNALGGATLHKGPVPAIYGDATSSVLETSLAPGDMEKGHGSATIGILAAKIKGEVPVIKDKMSVAVTGRRSYVDAFLKMIPKYSHTVMNFYDVTAKMRYRPSASHLIDASFTASRDNMAISDIMGMHWGNLGASVNWTARASDRVSFATTAAVTAYTANMGMDIMDVSQSMRPSIHNYSLNERIRVDLGHDRILEAGVRSQLLKVVSAEWEYMSRTEKELRSLWENSVWADCAGPLGGNLEFSAGVRLDIASSLKGDHFNKLVRVNSVEPQQSRCRTYIEAQPRLSLKYNLTPCHNIKAGYGITTQYLHAIRSTTTSFPFDRYALSSASVKPERAILYGLGYAGMTPTGNFDWSAEIYYRHISNVYDYMDGRNLFSDIALENIILGGKGRSYGAEFMVRSNVGPLTGWISYTLSRTQTRIDGINDNRWYNAANDRRHNLSVTAAYRLSDRWILSGSWQYSSGQPLTAPDVKYEIAGETCYYHSRRNAYVTPPSHRLDLSATYTKVGKKFTYQWSFGLFNTYCRYNPYVIYFTDDPGKPSGTKAVQLSMYGIVPSISYTLKF